MYIKCNFCKKRKSLTTKQVQKWKTPLFEFLNFCNFSPKFPSPTPPPPPHPLVATIIVLSHSRLVTDRAQSFVFCSQIITELINAVFLLVSNFKMIGMQLNVVYGQVQKS